MSDPEKSNIQGPTADPKATADHEKTADRGLVEHCGLGRTVDVGGMFGSVGQSFGQASSALDQ